MTILVGNTAVPSAEIAPAAAPKKHGLLPLLTVLFLISYGLMTMLIVLQGTTIESQRALIHDLFHDSMELSAVKNKVIQNKNAADAKHRGQEQAPSSKDQNPAAQSSSNQAAPQRRAERDRKPQLAIPSRPAADLADDRRAVITI